MPNPANKFDARQELIADVKKASAARIARDRALYAGIVELANTIFKATKPGAANLVIIQAGTEDKNGPAH